MPFEPPYDTMRDTVAQFLQNHPAMHAIGLPTSRSVFQADTVESPEAKPFLVIRWLETEATMGDSRAHPFDLWGYDDFGDYTRPSTLVRTGLRLMHEEMVDVATNTGRISQIINRGLGADLADEGFQALVIPGHALAIGNGE